MKRHFFLSLITMLFLTAAATAQQEHYWEIHDMDWPQPEVITPGGEASNTPPPSDAIVLFDGTDLSKWESQQGGDAPWKVENDYFEVVPKTGGIQTIDGFGDVQLHIEFATPEEVKGQSQGRGNSGVFFMGQYEVQVLDVYENQTYPDGQAGALYGQYPPLVNAARPPGEWQEYDIVFRAPKFDTDGNLLEPARVTVFHNRVLVQDNQILSGPTGHHARPPYTAHADRLPISLQDHGNPTRFRNIWLREIGEIKVPFAPHISPSQTYYEEEQKVTVTLTPRKAADTDIHFTLDGTPPTLDSPSYEGPFEVPMNTVLTVATHEDGVGWSNLEKQSYFLVDKEKNGIHYSYYEGEWEMLPDFGELEPVNEGTIYVIDLHEIETDWDHFGAVFTTNLKIDKAGEYTFTLTSDDGAKLYLDGEMIADNDGTHSATTVTATVTLEEGMHPLKLDYFEWDGGNALELLLEGPGLFKQPIPAYMLYLEK